MWLFFALLSPVLFSALTPLDRALRNGFVDSDTALTFGAMAVRIVFCLLMLVCFPLNFQGNWFEFGAFMSGFLTVLALVLYYRSLSVEKGAIVTMLMQMIPVFALVIAYFFLGEVLSWQQILAFVLIFGGGILAVLERGHENKFRLSAAFYLILFASIFWAGSDVLFKFSEAGVGDYWTTFFLYYLGSSWPLLFLLPFKTLRRRYFLDHYKVVDFRFWRVFIWANVLAFAGYCSLGFALTLGYASLTTLMYATMPIWTLVFAKFFSLFWSEVRAESFSRQEIGLKVAGFFLMALGLYFLI